MELVAATSSVLSAIESLLIVLDDRVQERLFRTEQRQPGSISRSLLRTQGRLTSKLPHLADQHLKIMMLGPVANTLERRINEIAAPEVGVLAVVKRRLLDDADSLRAAALGARSRVATLDDRARILQSDKSQILSTHTSLMSRLSGDAVLDQQIRHDITSAEDGLARIHIEEKEIEAAIIREVADLRQGLDAATQLLGGYVRLGMVHRERATFFAPLYIPAFVQLPIAERASQWAGLSDSERTRLINQEFDALRNINGIPLLDREEMQASYLRDVFIHGPDEDRKWLLEMGFLTDHGEASRRFIMLDVKERRYITAHGCEKFEDVQVNLEGTATKPWDPNGLGNMDNLDKKGEYYKKKGVCRTYLLYRDADFPQWYDLDSDDISKILRNPVLGITAELAETLKDGPIFDTRFSQSDVEDYREFMLGLAAAGDGQKFFDARFHSAGNGMVPELKGLPLDRVIMDDAAVNNFMSRRELPSDIYILKINQEGPVSELIRNSDSIESAVIPAIGFVNSVVTPSSAAENVEEIDINPSRYDDLEQDENHLRDLPEVTSNWPTPKNIVNSVVGLGKILIHENAQLEQNKAQSRKNHHSNGWTDEEQWKSEDLNRADAVSFRNYRSKNEVQ